jgi:dihydrofolate reductase
VGAVVLHSGVSLDGFFEGADADISWHRVDTELHQYMNDVLRPAAAFLEGRVTYSMMEDYWPTADAEPDVPPQIAEFAGIWRDTPKVVYSRTLQEVGPNTTLVRDVVPVDEFRIYVHPVVVGVGRRLFADGTPPLDLVLRDSHVFGNGVVLLHYTRG